MLEKKYKASKVWYIVGVLLAANIASWSLFARAESREYATLRFFDVGQGDAIYLRTASGNDILIDGGPGDAILSKLGKVMPFMDRTIELVILTHPHADHVSGLVEVLKRYRVQNVMVPEVIYESATYSRFRDLVEEKKVNLFLPGLGNRIFLDDSAVFDVYYPIIGKFDKAPKDINDSSIVGKLSFGRTNILLTGDAGKDIEQSILKLGLPVAAEILKVGHHGSRHSTGKGFVAAVDPAYSVISVGKNNYGHPHEEVLGVLTETQTDILRTDQEGDIVFKIYPDKIEQ